MKIVCVWGGLCVLMRKGLLANLKHAHLVYCQGRFRGCWSCPPPPPPPPHVKSMYHTASASVVIPVVFQLYYDELTEASSPHRPFTRDPRDTYWGLEIFPRSLA